jgi:hypothetical protein
LPIRECLAKRAARAKKLNTEEFIDWTPTQIVGRTGAKQLVEKVRCMNDAKRRVQANEGAAHGGKGTGDPMQGSLGQWANRRVEFRGIEICCNEGHVEHSPIRLPRLGAQSSSRSDANLLYEQSKEQ